MNLLGIMPISCTVPSNLGAQKNIVIEQTNIIISQIFMFNTCGKLLAVDDYLKSGTIDIARHWGFFPGNAVPDRLVSCPQFPLCRWAILPSASEVHAKLDLSLWNILLLCLKSWIFFLQYASKSLLICSVTHCPMRSEHLAGPMHVIWPCTIKNSSPCFFQLSHLQQIQGFLLNRQPYMPTHDRSSQMTWYVSDREQFFLLSIFLPYC